MNGIRIFFSGGLIGYRALFNWRQPAVFIPTMLGVPVFQILFFTYLGRYGGLADDTFFVVGNAIQTSAMAGVYGTVMALGNERQFDTLPAILATPAGRFTIFYGRSLPPIVTGMLVSAFGFAAALFLVDFQVSAAALPGVTVTLAVTVTSCAMFGLALGMVALRLKDIWLSSNLAYYLMLLLCGVNVPLSALPDWLAAIGRALPLTHGIEAARAIVGGAPLADVSGLLGREALTGAGYALLGYALLRLFEWEHRRRATLDT